MIITQTRYVPNDGVCLSVCPSLSLEECWKHSKAGQSSIGLLSNRLVSAWSWLSWPAVMPGCISVPTNANRAAIFNHVTGTFWWVYWKLLETERERNSYRGPGGTCGSSAPPQRWDLGSDRRKRRRGNTHDKRWGERERQTPAHIRHVCQHSHLSRFKNQRLNHRLSFKLKINSLPLLNLIEVHSN